MKKDTGYLVIKKGSTNIKQWFCIEVAKTAYKVRTIVNCTEGYSSLFSTKTGDEFWILNTDISTTGEAQYKIIEELENKI